MSGYIGNDGSALAGGLNPSGQVKGLSVDAAGNLNVNASVSSGPTNITQINGATFSNTNPMFMDLVRVLGAALSASNPVFAALSQGGALLTNGNPLPVSQIVGGNAISASNAEPNISNVQQLILNGQGFSMSTGKLTAGAAAQVGAALFANSIAKSVLIYAIQCFFNANSNVQTNFWTANDTNLSSSVSLTNANDKLGGSAPLCAMTYVNAAVVATGTFKDFSDVNANSIFNLLLAGKFYYIPANTAGGVAVYPNLPGANVWSTTFHWVEF